jgi:hypothetical protein
MKLLARLHNKTLADLMVIAFTLTLALPSQGHEQLLSDSTQTNSLQSLQVKNAMPAQSDTAIDLKFNEFYKLPVGPKGLELTPKILNLAGKKIRIMGYMAKADPALPDMFILSPVPVEMGDEDEKLVDDFPPNALFVHMSESQLAVPYTEGLMTLSGVLHVGNFSEPDGHVSTFQLELDPEIVRAFKRVLATTHASSK